VAFCSRVPRASLDATGAVALWELVRNSGRQLYYQANILSEAGKLLHVADILFAPNTIVHPFLWLKWVLVIYFSYPKRDPSRKCFRKNSTQDALSFFFPSLLLYIYFLQYKATWISTTQSTKYLFFCLDGLNYLACSHSNYFWNCESCTHSVGLLGWRISSTQSRYLHRGTQTEQT
jgi:hypothetical protein